MPAPHPSPPHRHHPWKSRTPRASSTPTTGHNPNRAQGDTTGRDSHQQAATHHSHAEPRASPGTGARPRTSHSRVLSTYITHPRRQKAVPQHLNTHDDPMALDIDSLPELELQNTEDTEQHMDLTPPTPEQPAASNPADPNHGDSPQNAPQQPQPRKQAPWTHLSNALRRHHPTHEGNKGPANYRASLEHDLPDVTGQGLHGYITTPPSPGAPTQECEEEYAISVTDMTA